MARPWDGSLDDLKTLVDGLGFPGKWQTDAAGKEAFRTISNGILNYWPSKGTIMFQGKGCEKFEEAYVRATAGSSASEAADTGKKVFVVYGHDDQARRDLELFLLRLKLEPYIMQSNATATKVIIEVLEGEIPEHSFGIVLLTPDDYGYAKTETETDRQPRARQNVILELGMLLGRLGRGKLAILIKGNVEIPSDLNGVLYIKFNEKITEGGMKLMKKLNDCGFDLDDADMAAALSD